MLFSVGYTLPYDQSWVIYSVSQVQNFLGDEGDYRPLQTPQPEWGTFPFWQPPDVFFGWGPRRKSAHFFNNISQIKTSVGAQHIVLFRSNKKVSIFVVVTNDTRVFNIAHLFCF
jgi:hypothetical protein